MKLNKKQKRGVRRQVDIDLGVNAPSTSIHKNKKKYKKIKVRVKKNRKESGNPPLGDSVFRTRVF